MPLTYPGPFLEVNTLTIVESGSIASKHFCYKEIKGKIASQESLLFSNHYQNSRQLLFLWETPNETKELLVACIQQHFHTNYSNISHAYYTSIM